MLKTAETKLHIEFF
uniref:Uncharacterized protein n=1 Tax=Rhizophora mucronata TaxID=61149 RepID=A0A2P2NC00_RHIMU